MILATEIGDKTFFIAAILSMRQSRSAVFLGAVLSLYVMTVLSSIMGLVLPKLVPVKYTHILGGILFLYFGIKLLVDARGMDSNQVSDELEEVEEELLHTKKDDDGAISLENGYVVPETYFSECAEAVAKLDAMIELLAPTQKVVESVCAEYTPEEVRAMAAEARAACAAAPAAKRDHARALDRARDTRAHLERVYAALLAEESEARRKIASVDALLAQTAAAGGNKDAEKAVRDAAERRAALARGQ